MGPYSNYTDQQILDEIAEYRSALKASMQGGIAEVQGEGRRIKYVGLDRRNVNAELRELYAEARRRGLEGYCGPYGTAIAVEIG